MCLHLSKYLDATQNRRRQLFCRRANAFFQRTSTIATAVAACRHELERLMLENL